MPGEAEKKEDLAERIKAFKNDLRSGEAHNTLELSKRTVDILRRIISQTRWTNAKELMDIVKREGRKLMAADRAESCIGNMVRRVLKIIRWDFVSSMKDEGVEDFQGLPDSMYKLEQFESDVDVDYTQPCPNLKALIQESTGELVQEIESSMENIAMVATEHIHTDETIMTYSRSHTVEAFLKKVASIRKFKLFILEGEPLFQGQVLAERLRGTGIHVTVMPDSHVYALMSRVNKVLIGAHTIFAEGGMKAECGAYNIALAAREHKVPVFVCAGMYKLSPENFLREDQEGFQKYVSPNHLMPIKDLAGMESLEVGNLMYEHVGPEFIDLYIFNTGATNPNMFRLVKEHYHTEDFKLQDQTSEGVKSP